MRQAELIQSLQGLHKKYEAHKADMRSLAPSVNLDLSQPCIILGGRNGAGKSRILRAISEEQDVNGVLIDLHRLIEHVLIILRSRDDFEAMLEEYAPIDISRDDLAAVDLIVGRQYESVQWYALELEPSELAIDSTFVWNGDQSLIPYFIATFRSTTYTSLGMGLGEFSIHFLLWILNQYRDEQNVTLLLDEPDAYLPPIGVSNLLYHIVRICLKRNWKVVLSTHSEEMIRLARDLNSFILLRIEENGLTNAIHSSDNPRIGDSLLSPSGLQRLFFCEDESAYHLIRAILKTENLNYSRETNVVWGDGDGYMRKLHELMPKPPIHDIEVAFVFDGDQRKRPPLSTGNEQWPAKFLPTDDDPDSLFKTLADRPDELSAALGTSPAQLREHLDTLAGQDPHDWVNNLGEIFGRAHTFASLATLWCALNPDQVSSALNDLIGARSA